MRTLVDSNVILDVVTDDAEWGDWSSAMLAEAAHQGPIVINPLVYAEVSCAYERIETLDDVLGEYFVREQLSWEAAFLAARAFMRYRKRGGTRRSALPDFYIGAHAAVAGYTLLTRDARRYRHYFPTVKIVAP